MLDSRAETKLKAHRKMTRSKKMPLAAYSAQLLNWLNQASKGRVVLDATTKEEQARLHERVRRFRELKVRMVEEKHGDAGFVAGVWIRMEATGGEFGFGRIILESKDAGLEALKATFKESLEQIPRVGGTPPEPKGPAPQEHLDDLQKFLDEAADSGNKPEPWRIGYVPPSRKA